MLKKLVLSISILFSMVASAQMQDLEQIMNNKKLIEFKAIFDVDNSLYGYISIYQGDLVDRYNMKYEYLILDKNLNKIARNEFTQRLYIDDILSFANCTKMGNNLIIKIHHFAYIGKNYSKFVYRTIDLSKNIITEEFYFDKGEFKDLVVENNNTRKKLKDDLSDFYMVSIGNKDTWGFLVLEEYKDLKNIYKVYDLHFYDENKKLKWTYNFNANATFKNYESIEKFYCFGDYLYLTKANRSGKKLKGTNIVTLDIKTGKPNFDYNLEDEKTEYLHDIIIKRVNNQTVISGDYFTGDGSKREWQNRLGLYRIVLDDKGKEISKKYVPWLDVGKYFEIKKNGSLGSGYRLLNREYFILDDATVCYLGEKYKELGNVTFMGLNLGTMSNDLVFMNFDKEFNLNNVNLIEGRRYKDLSLNYEFSQMIKNDNGFYLFFKYYKEDKTDKKDKWFLGINKYLNQKYSYEEIAISSRKEKFSIDIFPAKEGYILMREYNEKEKYNQVRLEKLNF
jgi:hypothetical protein